MTLPPLKAPEDIPDTRELKHKSLHPWLWRSDIYKTREAKALRKSAASSKYFEIGYYRYELARQWLLSKKPEAKADRPQSPSLDPASVGNLIGHTNGVNERKRNTDQNVDMWPRNHSCAAS